MRLALLALLLLVCNVLSAQNWALLNPDYKYNYSNDGTDTIVQQVAIIGTPIFEGDTMKVHLAHHTSICDTCTAADAGINAAWYIDTATVSILGDTVYRINDTWHLGPSGTLLLKPLANVGSTWALSQVPPITATITDAQWVSVLGTNDSTKTISLSTGDEIVTSKSFGILHWPASLGTTGGQYVSLSGIHGPDLGWLVPDWKAYFPYQQGDILQYYQLVSATFFGQHLTTDTKITMIDRVEFSDSIQFHAVIQIHKYGSINQWANVDETSIDTTIWTASANGLPLFRLLKTAPTGFFPATSGDTPIGTEVCGIAEYYKDSVGLTCVHPKRLDVQGNWTDCQSTQWPFLLGLQMEGLSTYPGAEQVWYTEGIGLRGYSFVPSGGLGQNTLRLVGAYIAGDTIGNLSTDGSSGSVLSGGPGLSVGPVPADDVLHVMGSTTLGSVQVWSMQGQLMLDRSAKSPQVDLDIADLSPGVYVLHVTNTNGPRSQRFIIAR